MPRPRTPPEPGTSAPTGEPPLLGVVVEVGLAEGLDALAAYADGGVRYLNHAGGATVAEADPTLEAPVRALLTAAQPVARAIGPWSGPRRPRPAPGVVPAASPASSPASPHEASPAPGTRQRR